MKKYLALTAALCLIASCASCGKENKTSAENSKPSVSSSETAAMTESTTEISTEEDACKASGEESEELYRVAAGKYMPDGEYQLYDSFTCKLPEEFELVPDETDYYQCLSDGVIYLFIIDGGLKCGCTPEAWVEYTETGLHAEDVFREKGVISVGKYDAGYYIYDSAEDEEFSFMDALISVGTDSALISFTYTSEEEERVRGFMEQILESAEYVGDEVIPTESYTLENDVFSLSLEPKWSQKTQRKSEDGEDSLSVLYTCAETASEFYSNLNLKTINMEEYPDAKSYYEYRQDSLKEHSANKLTECTEDGELLGEKCYKICCKKEFDYPTVPDLLTEEYIFEKNGRIIRIGFSTRDAEDSDRLLGELRDLANSVVVK